MVCNVCNGICCGNHQNFCDGFFCLLLFQAGISIINRSDEFWDVLLVLVGLYHSKTSILFDQMQQITLISTFKKIK